MTERLVYVTENEDHEPLFVKTGTTVFGICLTKGCRWRGPEYDFSEKGYEATWPLAARDAEEHHAEAVSVDA